jgi:hypothetical protein
MKRMFVLLAVLGAAVAVVAPMAFAGTPNNVPYSCTGDVPGITIAKGLNVPDGATCRLFGTEVMGNITVGTGATLHTFGFTADGNVNVNKGFFVDNNWGFTIKGNLSIAGSQGDPTSSNNGFWSNYSPSLIMGNFSYTNNLGWFYAEGGSNQDLNPSTWSEGATVNGGFTYSGNGRPYTGGLHVLGNSNIS